MSTFKRKKKSFMFLVLGLAALLVISACGGSDSNSSGSEENGKSQEFYTIGGGSTGGVFFSVASGFAQLLSNDTLGINASAQTTTGGGQNIQLMKNKELELAIADSLVSKQAIDGEGQFEGNPNEEIAAITRVYGTYFQQLIHPSSKIESMGEIKGKTIGVGGPGSGTELATRLVYEAHGFDYTDKDDLKAQYVGISEAADAMRNRQSDGMTSITPYPFSTFTELTMTGDGKLISLDNQAIEKLTSGDSVFLPGTIPAGTYKNQDEDVNTVMMQTMLIARSDLDEEFVYNLTKYIFENLDELKKQHNAFEELTLETATEGITIPLHPGAERYYKEQGVL